MEEGTESWAKFIQSNFSLAFCSSWYLLGMPWWFKIHSSQCRILFIFLPIILFLLDFHDCIYLCLSLYILITIPSSYSPLWVFPKTLSESKMTMTSTISIHLHDDLWQRFLPSHIFLSCLLDWSSVLAYRSDKLSAQMGLSTSLPSTLQNQINTKLLRASLVGQW